MCEVLLPDMTPHATNTRAKLRPLAEKFADQEPLFGIEQEYTFFKDGRPLGFPPNGFPAPQGVLLLRRRRRRGLRPRRGRGAPRGVPRRRARHLGHQRRGHARPVGVPGRARSARSTSPTSCGSRAGCCTASPRTSACRRRSTPSRSRATGTAPVRTPTSRPTRCARATTRSSRRARRSARASTEHVAAYGVGIEDRLTGSHETAPWSRVQLRRVEPRRVGAHPVAGRDRQEGLHRRPSPERQHGPLRRHQDDRRDLLQRSRRLLTPPTSKRLAGKREPDEAPSGDSL